MHGGGSILVQKPPSPVEIVNDRDSDITQFLRILRERTDDLRQWLRRTTLSYDTHRRFAHQFFQGYRPDDPVERAGRFLYLRYSQYTHKYIEESGVLVRASANTAERLQSWVDAADALAERYRHVQIENRDWQSLVNRFGDGPDVFWVIDPPYPDAPQCYPHGEIDHEALAAALDELAGDGWSAIRECPRRSRKSPTWLTNVAQNTPSRRPTGPNGWRSLTIPTRRPGGRRPPAATDSRHDSVESEQREWPQCSSKSQKTNLWLNYHLSAKGGTPRTTVPGDQTTLDQWSASGSDRCRARAVRSGGRCDNDALPSLPVCSAHVCRVDSHNPPWQRIYTADEIGGED